MPLSSSGVIKFSDINVELGVAANTPRKLSDSAVRTLFGVASGRITLSNGYGKSNRVTATITIASNRDTYNLRTSSVSGYVAGKTDVTLEISSGVYLYSVLTSQAALIVEAFASGDTVSIVNNGYIIGMGGAGGGGTTLNTVYPGQTAGPALSLGFNISVTNNGYIAGGGGGGGGVSYNTTGRLAYGGGGAGGGTSGSGEAGGGVGSVGTNGGAGPKGASGGRNITTSTQGTGASTGAFAPGASPVAASAPGTAGSGGGGGGAFAFAAPSGITRITAGTGQSTNVVGGNAVPSATDLNGLVCGGGGGGGWGSSGGTGYTATYPSGTTGAYTIQQTALGGAGGKAVNLNGYTVTWIANGTRWGAIS
jgi:hypothetical protein